MIEIIGFNNEGKGTKGLNFDDYQKNTYNWYWVDFIAPNQEEINLLDSIFHFHHLAIEDCVHFLQRPKVDFYNDYQFFVYHSISKEYNQADEINVFLGKNYIVSFHSNKDNLEIQKVKEEVLATTVSWDKVNVYITYLILDKIVDHFFPVIYSVEDKLDEFNQLTTFGLSKKHIENLYAIRRDLLKLRRTITSMRDLVYRIINSTHLKSIIEGELYYVDIYDHLLKLSDMVEANRDMTSDIRDSYMSMNSNRMNVVMTMLTVITAIFIPLTFISGIYGMNFDNMPELNWRFGYYGALGVMGAIAVSMLLWFKKKGWFDFYK